MQKCVRTLDIEEVGKTTRHGSFFQMAGNFSFGDYFKKGAIDFAWELLTELRRRYALPEDKLWTTVYLDDDEALELWKRYVPEERIQRRDKADNYWHMGVPGPGGPCSEIYYDRGSEHGREGGPVADEDRYLEVWNLVFMQYQLSEVRTQGRLRHGRRRCPRRTSTPAWAWSASRPSCRASTTCTRSTPRAPSSTGPPRSRASRTAPRPTPTSACGSWPTTRAPPSCSSATASRPATRAATTCCAGSLRRAVRSMRLLGAQDPTIEALVEAAVGAMGPQYPSLVQDAARITAVAVGEEASFLETLTKGATVFDLAVPEAVQSGGVLSGSAAFALHDTYGFPIDLTLEMAAEQGLSVDEAGFRTLMAEQRDRAKADAKARKSGGTDLGAYRALLDAAGGTEFTGYAEVSSEGTLRGLLLDGAVVPSAAEGAVVDVVLDRSPFYAEGGGQKADLGRLELADGTVLEVRDVQRTLPGLTVHKAVVVSGEARVGAGVLAEVDVERRKAISRAHTATHLVHTAFRAALGEQATQAGSENNPGRFRFDFASPSAVPASVLADVEQTINEIALADLEVRAFVTTQDEARRIGAMALFGEKYGDEVRVVEVGDYARELCGGTHAARSGQLGMVKLLSEASIGSGVRRVEGLVGLDAYSYLAREHVLLAQLASAFKVPADEVPARVEATIVRLREVEKELAGLRAGQVLQQAGAFAAGARDVFGVQYAGVQAPDGTPGDLVRQLALDVRGRLQGPGVVLVAAGGERVTLVAAVNEAARATGHSANGVLRAAAPAVDGKGGGKDDVAQGGGSNPAGIPDALVRAEHEVGRVATAG